MERETRVVFTIILNDGKTVTQPAMIKHKNEADLKNAVLQFSLQFANAGIADTSNPDKMVSYPGHRVVSVEAQISRIELAAPQMPADAGKKMITEG